MKELLALTLLFSLGSAQFVFFGGRFGQGRPQSGSSFTSFNPAPPQPTVRFGVRPEPEAATSSAPAPVTTPAPAPAPAPAKPAIEKIPVRHDLKAEDFFGPLFRSPNRIFHSPKKHSKEIIMGVNEALNEVKAVQEQRSGKLVVLPDPVTTTKVVTTTTTARPTTTTTRRTTTTARPTTTTRSTTTTARTTTTVRTTTTAKPTTTTARPVTTTTKKAPLQIKSFVVNSFGQAVSRPSSPSVSSSSSSASASPAVTPVRAAKALESASRPKGNYQYQGKNYLLTWRNRRNNFDWNGGVSYCRSQGMKLISLDTKEKAEHFLRLVASDRAPYFWAGGRVSRDSRSLTWQNGKTESVSRGQHPWSFTGRTGPQPDGGESCLAILNNVYRDGVKFHDVACHHRKPVVCEEE